jgi:hypothetical protein
MGDRSGTCSGDQRPHRVVIRLRPGPRGKPTQLSRFPFAVSPRSVLFDRFRREVHHLCSNGSGVLPSCYQGTEHTVLGLRPWTTSDAAEPRLNVEIDANTKSLTQIRK